MPPFHLMTFGISHIGSIVLVCALCSTWSTIRRQTHLPRHGRKDSLHNVFIAKQRLRDIHWDRAIKFGNPGHHRSLCLNVEAMTRGPPVRCGSRRPRRSQRRGRRASAVMAKGSVSIGPRPPLRQWAPSNPSIQTPKIAKKAYCRESESFLKRCK